jgi:hypothetical protein
MSKFNEENGENYFTKTSLAVMSKKNGYLKPKNNILVYWASILRFKHS